MGHEPCVTALLGDERVDTNILDDDVRRLSAVVPYPNLSSPCPRVPSESRARTLFASLSWTLLKDRLPADVMSHQRPLGAACNIAQGWTPLYAAANNGHELCVRALLANARSDVDAADRDVSRPSQGLLMRAFPHPSLATSGLSGLVC